MIVTKALFLLALSILLSFAINFEPTFPVPVINGQIETGVELKGKGFSLNYPEGWTPKETIVPASGSNSEDGEIYFISGDQIKDGFIIFGFNPLGPSELQVLGLPHNTNRENIESKLSTIFPQLVKWFQSGFSYSMLSDIDDPVYGKYTIDGYKVGSVLYNLEGNSTLRGLAVGTVIGNNSLIFGYSSAPSIFDKNLPTIEDVIESIKIEENFDESSSSNNEDKNNQSSNNNGNNPEDYVELDELVSDIKTGDVDAEKISLSAFQNSGAYQEANQETQDCIDRAGKIGHNLTDKEIVKCSEDADNRPDN